MGTTVEKATKAIQSISEIQQGINNLGGSLTDQTPLDEFRSELDDIYNNLPKTSYEEGSNITLENCLKGKLDYEDNKVGYGDSYQDSTNGYQLLDDSTFIGGTRAGITTTIDGAEIIANGSVASGSNSQINIQGYDDYITLTAGEYTLSANNPVASSSQNTLIRLMKVANGATTSAIPGSSANLNVANATKTFTITEQSDCVIQLRTDGGETLTNFVIKPMLESGSTAHEWEKYTGRNCCT